MWLVPLLAGLGIAGQGTTPAVLLFFAALGLFLARAPITLWVRGTKPEPRQRRWLGAYLAVGLALGTLVVLRYDRWLLPPMALVATAWLAVHLALARVHRERSVAGQWVGVAGLTLAGPATYYAATGTLGTTAASIWGLSFLYFGYPIYYVKLKMDPIARKSVGTGLRTRLLQGRQVLLYQVMTLAIVTGLAAAQVAPWTALVAFVPATVQVFIGALHPAPQLNLKRLGFTQVGHSIAFGVLLVLAFRL